MREAERVIYRGLPWRVESINMYTVLRNPELHGVLRIRWPSFIQSPPDLQAETAGFPHPKAIVCCFLKAV